MKNEVFIEHLNKELKEYVTNMCIKEAQLAGSQTFMWEVTGKIPLEIVNTSVVWEDVTEKEYEPCPYGRAGGLFSGSCKDPGGCEYEEDDINHPKHYEKNPSAIEVSENWELPHHLACIIKYLCRYRDKGNPLKDLKKAQWYLSRFITRMEKGETDESNKD